MDGVKRAMWTFPCCYSGKGDNSIMQTLQSWTKQFFKRELIATKPCNFSVDRNLRIPENKEAFKIFPPDAFRIEMWVHSTLFAKRDRIPNAAPNQMAVSTKDTGKRKRSGSNFIQISHEEFRRYLMKFYLYLKKSTWERSEYI